MSLAIVKEEAFVRGVHDAAHGKACRYKRGTIEWFAWLEGFSAYFAPAGAAS